VRGSCSRGGLSGWFCVDEKERGQRMGSCGEDEDDREWSGQK